MPTDYHWTFRLTGSLARNEGTPILEAYELIVESGIRDSDSPYALRSVGAIAYPDAEGSFSTSFVTQGAPTPPKAPSCVSVFVRESMGKWQPFVVAVSPARVHPTSAKEMLVDLGPVNIGPNQMLFVCGAD